MLQDLKEIAQNRKVVGIGETILDIVFRDNQPQKAVPGGSTFNCMVSLGRCKVPALFLSEFGKDKVGDIIRSFMEKSNLSSEYIDFYEDGKTPVSMAFLNENQDAEYLFYRDFPQNRFNIKIPEINENDIVVYGSYFSVNPVLRGKVSPFLEYAKDQKAILYYDINIRKAHIAERHLLDPSIIENFKCASIIRCSDEDLKLIFPGKYLDDCIRILYQYCNCVIVTRGSKEIILSTPHFQKKYEVEALQPISTIGAGDSFNAGFIFAMMRFFVCQADFDIMLERSWDKLIHYAKKFASDVCLSLDNYVSFDFSGKHKYYPPR